MNENGKVMGINIEILSGSEEEQEERRQKTKD